MPRKLLSTDEVAAFQERICAVGAHLFATYGYEGVSMRRVASALGVTAMALYRYVDNKEHLLALIRTEAYREFADGQERAARTPAPVDRLFALAEDLVAFALAHPDKYRIMFDFHQTTSGNYPPQEVQMNRASAPVAHAVAEAIASGELVGDADALPHVFFGALHGILSLHLASKLAGAPPIAILVKETISVLFRGTQPPQSASSTHAN